MFVSMKHTFQKRYNPVRKTPVLDHSSSEKFSEESAPLRLVENSQNYQIWSRIDRVIKTFLFTSSSYNARKKRAEKKWTNIKIIFTSHIELKKIEKFVIQQTSVNKSFASISFSSNCFIHYDTAKTLNFQNFSASALINRIEFDHHTKFIFIDQNSENLTSLFSNFHHQS